MSSRSDLVLRTALVVITVLAVIGLAWFLIQITEILLIVLVSAILATGVAPLAATLEGRRWSPGGRRLSRTWSIFVVYLAAIAVLTVIIGLLVTPVVIETQGFVANLPANIERITTALRELRMRFPWLPDMAGWVEQLPNELSSLSRYAAPAAGVAFRFLGGVATVITVLFLAFYMLVGGPEIKAGFLALFPRSDREEIADILNQVGAKFGGWLRGQLLLSFIIGVAAAFGMAVIRMPYPILLGIVAGITELIPLVGPTLGAIPAVFLALFQPWWKLIFTIAWYTLIQQTEGNFIVPRVMRRAVGLSPLLTIVALIIGIKLLGMIGALLAVPVAAVLQVVVGEILRRFRPQD